MQNKESKKGKERKETLLLKYGIVAFLEILVFMTIFLSVTTYMTKKPVSNLYSESIDSVLDQAVDFAQNWLDNQIEVLNVYQRSVVDAEDNVEGIKGYIKTKPKPNGFDYVMVFWDTNHDANDGGPETFNSKGGSSKAGILEKEYYKMHKQNNVDVWLESPRMTNTGVFTMPLFTKLEYIDDVTGEELYELRQYGPSKEHRPNPIVEMGLFMDKDGIPINMGLYPGNMNEQKTVSSLETKMIKSLKNKKLIYCGDAGLGSASIRAFNDMGGRAFIVTQSIKKLSDELQNEIFNDSGYKLLSNNSDITLSQMKSFDRFDENNISLYQDKAYKEILIDSNIDLGLFEEKQLKNGKTKTVKSKANLKQRIIITYSRKMAEYQKNIRSKQIERAKSLLVRGVDDVRKGPNDIARFIKSTNKNTYSLDQDRITLEEKYDGFYAIATNLLSAEDTAKEIIEINSQRYKIEDCFRVLKTNFDARPVYHRLDNRITAHFMICYTALLIYRLLEKQLKEKGYHFTINEILTTLKNMNLYEDYSKYNSLYTQSSSLDALIDISELDFDAEYFKPSYINKILKKIS